METCMGVVWLISPFSANFKGSKVEFGEGVPWTLGLAKTSRATSWLVECEEVVVEFPGALALAVEPEESVTSAGSVSSAVAASCVARRLSRFCTAALMDALCPTF